MYQKHEKKNHHNQMWAQKPYRMSEQLACLMSWAPPQYAITGTLLKHAIMKLPRNVRWGFKTWWDEERLQHWHRYEITICGALLHITFYETCCRRKWALLVEGRLEGVKPKRTIYVCVQLKALLNTVTLTTKLLEISTTVLSRVGNATKLLWNNVNHY